MGVNNPLIIKFTLTAAQIKVRTLCFGITACCATDRHNNTANN